VAPLLLMSLGMLKSISLEELEMVGGGYSIEQLASRYQAGPSGWEEGNHYASFAYADAQQRYGMGAGEFNSIGWGPYSQHVASGGSFGSPRYASYSYSSCSG